MEENLKFDTQERIEFVSFHDGIVVQLVKAIAEAWPSDYVGLVDLVKSFGYLPFMTVYTDCIVIENLKKLEEI